MAQRMNKEARKKLKQKMQLLRGDLSGENRRPPIPAGSRMKSKKDYRRKPKHPNTQEE